jgi:hypothetical protein
MRRIQVTVSVGLVGCKRVEEFDVVDDATDDEIEDEAIARKDEIVEWNFKEIPPKGFK